MNCWLWNSSLAVRAARPTFYVPIADVVLLRAQPKVSRITARRVIASMINLQAFGDRAKGQLICHTMRAARHAACSNRAVSVGVARTHPGPTFIRASLIYFGPEPLSNGPSRVKVVPRQKWIRFAQNTVGLGAILGGEFRVTATTALTETIRDFCGGCVRIVLHVEPPIRCVMPGVYSAPPGFLMPYYSMND